MSDAESLKMEALAIDNVPLTPLQAGAVVGRVSKLDRSGVRAIESGEFLTTGGKPSAPPA